MFSYTVLQLFLFLSLLIGPGVTGSVWLWVWTRSCLVPHYARVSDDRPESRLPQVALLWTLNPIQKLPSTTFMDHSRPSGSVYTNGSDSTDLLTWTASQLQPSLSRSDCCRRSWQQRRKFSSSSTHELISAREQGGGWSRGAHSGEVWWVYLSYVWMWRQRDFTEYESICQVVAESPYNQSRHTTGHMLLHTPGGDCVVRKHNITSSIHTHIHIFRHVYVHTNTHIYIYIYFTYLLNSAAIVWFEASLRCNSFGLLCAGAHRLSHNSERSWGSLVISRC